jgi:hypothetical protein
MVFFLSIIMTIFIDFSHKKNDQHYHKLNQQVVQVLEHRIQWHRIL